MVLQGSGRGEEATKKLLANGSVSPTNSHRPQGMRRNSPATKVRRMHACKPNSHAKQHQPRTTALFAGSASLFPVASLAFPPCKLLHGECGVLQASTVPDTPTQVSSSLG